MSPQLFHAEIDYPESTDCSLLVLNKDNGIWSHLHVMMQPPNKLSFLPAQHQSREGVWAPWEGGRRLCLVPCSLGTALKKPQQAPKQLKKKH